MNWNGFVPALLSPFLGAALAAVLAIVTTRAERLCITR